MLQLLLLPAVLSLPLLLLPPQVSLPPAQPLLIQRHLFIHLPLLRLPTLHGLDAAAVVAFARRHRLQLVVVDEPISTDLRA